MLEEGDLDAATSWFQEALRYRPDHVQSLIGLSRVFAAKGDAESALLVARQGVTMSNREDPQALDALAKALAVLGQLDEAVKAAQEALPLARRLEDVSLADSLEVRIERYRGGGRP
jgi:Flp pilus assembly protein TadD